MPERQRTAAFERARWWDWLFCALFLASLPFILYAILHVRSNTSDVARWLPAGTPERATYDAFVERFGADEVLVVSWEGCRLDDPRLKRFTDAARAELATSAAGAAPMLARITSSGEIWERLTAPPISIPEETVRARLGGILLGRETGVACVVLHASEQGKSRSTQLISRIEAISLAAGVPAADLRLGGSIFEAEAIDQESIASLRNFVVPSGLAVVALAFLFVRGVRLTLLMLIISVYCQALSVAVIHFSGGSLDAVLIVMPTLIYVTAMSGALHMVNYYRAAVLKGEAAPSVWMLQRALFPCIGASVTTAIGLGSLIVSQVEPVRSFGFFASLNVLLALVILLLAMPAFLRISSDWSIGAAPAASQHWEGWNRFARWLSRRHAPIALLCLVATVGLGGGVLRLKSALNLQQMFSPESRLVQNYAWLERNLGPLISIEAVVLIQKSSPMTARDRIRLLDDVEARLQALPEVSATISPVMFVPPLPKGGSLGATARRSKILREFDNHRTSLAEEGVYAETPQQEFWRITARLPALAGHEYGAIVDTIRETAQGALRELPAEQQADVAIEITGITPVVYRAQHQILSDLFNSFLSAFILICPLMMFHMRSVIGGLTAMIPNVAPVAIVFGTLGWSGVPLDIGIVLTASVGLGIAVDGTLHFVDWYRSARERGFSHEAALGSCFETCAVAMTQTTLIVGLGLLVFVLSPFIPTQRFALLLAFLLLVALMGDLLMMPALLSGVLGRFFHRAAPAQDPSSDGSPLR